jgi:hypothetical protein
LGGDQVAPQWIAHYFKIGFPLIEDQVLDNEYTREIRVKDGFVFKPTGLYTRKSSYIKNMTFDTGMLYVKPVGALTDSQCRS